MTNHSDDNPRSKVNTLFKQALMRLKERHPTVSSMTDKDVAALIDELEVHQVELDGQNEELRRAETELIGARDLYLDLYEFAPAAYLSLDSHGVILKANLTTSQLCGVDRQKILNKRIETLVVSEDRDKCYRHLRNAAASDEKYLCELRFQRPDGSTFWGLLNILSDFTTMSTESQNGFLVMVTDITSQKKCSTGDSGHTKTPEPCLGSR